MDVVVEGEETSLWNRFLESLNTNKFLRIPVHMYLGKFMRLRNLRMKLLSPLD